MKRMVAVLTFSAFWMAGAQPPPVPGSPASGTTATNDTPWFTKKDKSKPTESGYRDVTGTVFNQKQQPVAGARVTITDTESGESQEVTTGKSGIYRFYSTKGDRSFKLTATFKGRVSNPRSLTPFDTRNTPNIDLTLSANAPASKEAAKAPEKPKS